MKNYSFLLVFIFLSVINLSGQKTEGHISVDLGISKTGSINRVELKNDSGELVGYLGIKKRDSKVSDLSFDFSPIGSLRTKVEFIRTGSTIFSNDYNNGPSVQDEKISREQEVIYSETFDTNEDWWWGILAVAYCCLEIDVSFTEVEGGYQVTSSIGFDCDCLESSSSESSVWNSEGTSFSNVDQIIITAL